MSKTQLVKNNKQAKQILSSHAFWNQNFIFKTNLSEATAMKYLTRQLTFINKIEMRGRFITIYNIISCNISLYKIMFHLTIYLSL